MVVTRVQLSVTLGLDTKKMLEDSCPKDITMSKYVEHLVLFARRHLDEIDRKIGENK